VSIPHETWRQYVAVILSLEAGMRACVSRFARNNADRDELLQETYAKLLAIDPARLATIHTIPGFALITARRTAIDWLRHKMNLEIEYLADVDVLSHPGGMTSTEDLVQCHQELERLCLRVDQLPRRCAQVFALHRIIGLSQKEVALLLGISVNTVEQHMLKASRELGWESRESAAGFSVPYRLRKRARVARTRNKPRRLRQSPPRP
jgi:RNA polymerase sigma-70 factor (ECF subfamily)